MRVLCSEHMSTMCICEVCGKSFAKKRSTTGKYCSPGCWYVEFESRKKPRPCAACGKPFKDKDRVRHCSLACSQTACLLRRDYPEPPPVHGARWVQLGHGRFALVDDSDYDSVSRGSWTAVLERKPGRRVKCVTGHMNGRTMLLHSFIFGTRETIDHRDGNPLNNRRSNLRLATALENVRNASKKRRNGATSRFKGVWLVRKTGKWQAMIRAGDVRRWLGSFSVEEDAARAYDAAARELHGAFACVNFPNDGERCAITVAA